MEAELALTSDPSSLPNILGQLYQKEAPEGSSSSGRGGGGRRGKLGVRERRGVLDGLLNGILARAVTLSPPPYLQSSLLHILSEVDSEVSSSGSIPYID